jgi:hypothetical protein
MGKELTIISLGWGVQSFTLAALSALGELPPVDYALHSDTGYESSLTYKFAEKWMPWLESHGVKVVTLKNKNEITNIHNFVQIPAYSNNGILKRQCTTWWKIIPMRRWTSDELRRRGLTKKPNTVSQWIGISTDEFCRAKLADVKYIKNRFPLLETGMSREGCKTWLTSRNLEVPPKSSCVFCPFHSKAGWQQTKAVEADWEKAVTVDRYIRNLRLPGELYVHQSLKPLEEVDLRTPEETGQMNFTEMCQSCWN